MLTIVKVSGDSMAPTLCSNERVICMKPLKKSFLKRGQIVILSHLNVVPLKKYAYLCNNTIWQQEMERMSEVFIKRIIGLPFDIVRISLSEIPQYLLKSNVKVENSDGYAIWHIPNGHVFVRGDGSSSVDSVVWGPIPVSAIHYIVLCRYPSLRRIR